MIMSTLSPIFKGTDMEAPRLTCGNPDCSATLVMNVHQSRFRSIPQGAPQARLHFPKDTTLLTGDESLIVAAGELVTCEGGQLILYCGRCSGWNAVPAPMAPKRRFGVPSILGALFAIAVLAAVWYLKGC